MSPKICLIICYFGKLPSYFELFKMTCKYNPSIDFLIYTDQEMANIPSNVIVKKTTLSEIKHKCELIFPDINISLDRPYKLCDYKPAYGEIFECDITEYDFWGHCDIDILCGNIRKFITDDILRKYDKIFGDGQFSLIRNTKENNRRYRMLSPKGCQSYQNVYECKLNRAFDEWAEHMGGGVPAIYERNGINIYKEQIYQDISFLKTDFVDSFGNNRDRQCYFFDNGDLYSYYIEDGKICSREYLYCHFQKRLPQIIYVSDKDTILFSSPNKAYLGVSRDALDDWKSYTKINKRHINVASVSFEIDKLKKFVKMPLNIKIEMVRGKIVSILGERQKNGE